MRVFLLPQNTLVMLGLGIPNSLPYRIKFKTLYKCHTTNDKCHKGFNDKCHKVDHRKCHSKKNVAPSQPQIS